jgi:hypothetical protein
MTDGAIPVDKLKSERSAQYADLEARSRAEMTVVQEDSLRAPLHLIKRRSERSRRKSGCIRVKIGRPRPLRQPSGFQGP